MIEFVFYDLDGVLVTSERYHYRCWKEVLSNIGIKLFDYEYCPLKGKSTNDIASILIENKKINLKKIELITLKRKLFVEKLSLIKMNNSILEVISYCSEKKIKMGVITASTRSNAVRILKNNNMLKEFEFVIGREDSVKNKPFPDLYIKGLQLANVDPESAIAIEDSITGYQAAINAGIPCIFFNENPNLVETGVKHIMTTYAGNEITTYLGEH